MSAIECKWKKQSGRNLFLQRCKKMPLENVLLAQRHISRQKSLEKLALLVLFYLLWNLFIFSFFDVDLSAQLACLSLWRQRIRYPRIHHRIYSYLPIWLLNILRVTVLAKTALALQWIWMVECWCVRTGHAILLCQIVFHSYFINKLYSVCAYILATYSEAFPSFVAAKTSPKSHSHRRYSHLDIRTCT